MIVLHPNLHLLPTLHANQRAIREGSTLALALCLRFVSSSFMSPTGASEIVGCSSSPYSLAISSLNSGGRLAKKASSIPLLASVFTSAFLFPVWKKLPSALCGLFSLSSSAAMLIRFMPSPTTSSPPMSARSKPRHAFAIACARSSWRRPTRTLRLASLSVSRLDCSILVGR